MNEQIRKQLEKVRSVKIDFTDSTTHIFIPRVKKILPSMMVQGKVYRISVGEHIIHPTTNSMLASNWNGGKSPTAKEYFAEYLSSMSNMYKLNCTAVGDPSNDFYGWLPDSGFEILDEIQ